MRIEEKIFLELSKQNIFSQDQAKMLLLALKESLKSNEELAAKLKLIIQDAHELGKRVEFYRTATTLKVSEDAKIESKIKKS